VSIKKEDGEAVERDLLPIKKIGRKNFVDINKRYLSIVFEKILRYKVSMPV